MHIAILVTNTDISAFAARFPDDGAKFSTLLGDKRPDWRFSVFAVAKGRFPESLDHFDGLVVTGSPASVHDKDPWIGALLELLRQAVIRKLPVFGACFGHQALAMALGGMVGKNPSGWVFGRVETEVSNPGPWQAGGKFGAYAAHTEQVTRAPAGAIVLGETPDCPIASFAIGDHVFTTQYHPEMTHDFIAALIEKIADGLGQEGAEHARASLKRPADNARMAAEIVQFFEMPRRI